MSSINVRRYPSPLFLNLILQVSHVLAMTVHIFFQENKSSGCCTVLHALILRPLLNDPITSRTQFYQRSFNFCISSQHPRKEDLTLVSILNTQGTAPYTISQDPGVDLFYPGTQAQHPGKGCFNPAIPIPKIQTKGDFTQLPLLNIQGKGCFRLKYPYSTSKKPILYFILGAHTRIPGKEVS